MLGYSGAIGDMGLSKSGLVVAGEELPLICEGKFDLGSSCTQSAIIDAVNILFLLAFFISLLVCSVTKKNTAAKSGRRDWAVLATSICSALISAAYFGAGFLDLIAKTSGFLYFARGVIWISLTASLLVKRPKWVVVQVSVWWVLFFVLISALNITVLARKLQFQILDILAWPVNFLLLFCAVSNFYSFFCGDEIYKYLSEPLLLDEEPEKKRSRTSHASFFSKLTFSWINPLLRLGYSKILALEDIPCLVPEDEAAVAYEIFRHAWEGLLERKEKRSSDSKNLIFKALGKVYMKELVLTGTYALLKSLCVVVAPLLLYGFVNYSIEESSRKVEDGLVLVGCLAAVKVVESLSQRHFYFNSRRTGMRMRSALMVAIYKKQLNLSSLGRQRHSTGEIVNYIAVDAYRMGEFPTWFHMAWTLSVQLFLAVGVLFGIMGYGALPGLVPLIVFGALNIPFAKLLQKCQSQVMIAQDKRLRSTSEILNSMKIIKLQSWEDKFMELIESYRETEFHWLAESQYKKAFGYALYWVSPTLVSSVVFFGCVLLGGSAPLDAGTVFTVLATLRTMSDPVKLIPDALSAIIQARVSFDRIESFLLDHELTSDDKPAAVPCPDSESICIIIEAGNFSWDPESAVPTLKNVNMEVSRGQKVAVCGPVGAGKSSLLHAILGEIPKVSRNNVKVFGSIAYVPQSSFIQSGTIRDNILYGKPMEKSTYEKVVKACALDKDISSFDHGDLTEIGQRGLNLSGGQKQRIQLARALYNDAEIYLLDDPFSAVDAHTAATLFNDCVMGALEKKTVILVTHQVEFLSQVDKTMVIKDGEVVHSGSYKELSVAGGAVFKQLVEAHRNSIDPLDDPNVSEHHNKNVEEITRPEIISRENSEDEVLLETLPGIQLTEDEERQTGSVDLKSLLDYIVIPKGSLLFSSIVLSHIAFSALQVAASYWLAFGIEIPDLSSVVLIGGYTVISTSSVLFVYLRSLSAALLGLKASKAFFSGFTNSIFKAPMLFFDSTPVGRILTRASADFSVLDNDIHFSLGNVVAAIVEMITIITVLAYNTWQILFIAVFTMGASIYLQEYYKSSATELTRINGTTKAPVMSYASETALGVATIRAYKTADRFFMNYLKLIDTDAKVFLHSNASLEWLVLRAEGLQNLTSVAAAFLLILLPKGVISPGLVGLSMSYILTLSSMQVILTRWYSNLCNYIISVERIKQFMHITPEPPAVLEDRRPPLSWPSKGRIELQDLKIKYRPNAPLVLKGITCSFKEGTRVGVVGRTGSGKTTLISALFRLVEPHSGRILIDKIDICSIGLKDLRLKLSIIPQEPSLFKGNVRTNLDPLGLYSDDDIWKVLEKCQLKDTISSLPNLLDSSVSDEGENWSSGQRQLFCLGRVLLRRNKILVLDEATASIDFATDAILQNIIRQEFSNCTVITVAHRVPTVIDSDMVMLLSFGKLVEYDAPSRLMETDSAFSKLVAEYWASCSRNSS